MNKYDLVERIEEFAPLELAESWDCSGWLVNTGKTDVKKIMLALTVTEDVFAQAVEKGCDMIISHHPLFVVPLSFKNIDIYCAHTNLDKAKGGTTDELINVLGLGEGEAVGDFLRVVDVDMSIEDLFDRLRVVSLNIRFAGKRFDKQLKKIAFCAGSGADFREEAYRHGADILVTGDVKFHQALDSKIPIFDIGHFESEVLVLDVLEELIKDDVEVIHAQELPPIVQLDY